MKTNYENLRARLIEIYNKLLSDYEHDIESGIDENIYEEEHNIETRMFIEEAKKVIEDFTKYEPAIYIYIEGNNIQGISGTENISINKFDTEDYKTVPEEQEMTPEEWEQSINDKTNSKEIRAIY